DATEEEPVAAADDGLHEGLPGEAETGPDVVLIDVAFGARVAACPGEQGAAAERESGDLDRKRGNGIEAVRDAVVALGVRSFEFVAEADVEGPAATDAPTVLDKDGEVG